MLKTFLKVLMWLVGSVLVLFAGLFVYLDKPYIRQIDEFRTSGQLETVQVSYGHACGEEFFSNGEEKYIIAIPEGGKHPLDIPGLYFDSSFELVCYSYMIKRKNYLTGEITSIRSRRFDTVEWRAILPYNVYDPGSEEFYKKIYSPVKWKNKKATPKFVERKNLSVEQC